MNELDSTHVSRVSIDLDRSSSATLDLLRLSAKDLERLVQRARVNVLGVGSESHARCQVGVVGERVEQVPLLHVIDANICARARQILTTVVKDHFSDLKEPMTTRLVELLDQAKS